MEAALSTVEQACKEFYDPSTSARAEQVLVQFRQSTQPLPACQYILEKSASVEARFHAACTLREATIRDWSTLSDEARHSLRVYLLQYTIKHASEPALAVVRSALLAALALNLKRGWLEAPHACAAFLQDIPTTVAAAGGMAAQRTGVELLEAIVMEFALASASPLGLAWDYHEWCCRDLEAKYLQGFFVHAVSLARSVAASGAAVCQQDQGLCAACMSLLISILGWDFRRPALPGMMVARRGVSDATPVAPGSAWSSVLLSEGTTGWLVALLPSLPARASLLAVKARQLLVAFCSLAGDVLPKKDEGGLVAGYLRQMLRGVLPWIYPADAALHLAQTSDEQQLLDACRAICALATTHKLHALEAASQGVVVPQQQQQQQQPGFLKMLEAVTLSLVRSGSAAEDGDNSWVQESTDMLLEAWAMLTKVAGSMSIVSASSLVQPEDPLPRSAVDAAASVYCALVDSALQAAAAGAHDDTAVADEAGASARLEEGLSRAAGLARCAPAAAFWHTAQLLVERQHALQSCLAQGSDPAEVLEQLVWLLLMASHCLADSGAGERALPPLAVLTAAESGGPAAAAIEQLCRCLLELPSLVLQPAWRPALSPRVMEAAVLAVGRWADTYLMPEDAEDLPAGGLRASYAAGAQAADAALDMLVRVASTCLANFPGEGQLHLQVVTGLLPALVRRPAMCQRLVQLPSFQELVGAFASRQPVLTQQLTHKMHRALAQSLTAAAGGLPNAPAAQQYVGQLLHTTASQVIALAQLPDLQEQATKAGVIMQLCCLLDTLRGANCATASRSQIGLFAVAEQLLGPLLVLQRAFRSESAVVSLLLKLAATLVENHVSYLPPAKAEVLLQWVLQLLRQHSASCMSQQTSEPSRALREAREAEQARELRALLQLLTHVTQRDLVDFGSDPAQPAQQFDVAQVVLLGLSILLPLMSVELLKFPKLCRLFFSLLTYMLEVYPEQFALLEPSHFTALMQSLEFGLMHADTMVLSCALEGLAGLAKYQFQAQQAGNPGLSGQRAGGTSGEGVVPHFMRLLLRRLLMEDAALDVVELAGDALLPLLLCDTGTYQQLGMSLLQGQDADAAAKLTTALMSLTLGNGVTQDLSRPNRRQFRQNLCQMVADVRGLIRVR